MGLRKYYIFSALFFIAFTLFVGCRKKEDTIAKIHVRDAQNAAVVGAQVVLYGTSSYGPGEPNPAVILFDTTTTNGSGEAVFNFNDEYQLGQAGVAVLDIEVTTPAGLTGKGVIKVEEETTTEETVFVN